MATYIYYPQRSDGSALVFHARDCVDDAEALAQAKTVSLSHTSAVAVMVWCGDRHVGNPLARRGPDMTYEERAKEAEESARRAETEVERRAFEEVAEIWRELAARKNPTSSSQT